MCGEHISTVGCHDVKAGSSPHVRGARGLLLPRGIVLGIIPACAGSTSYLAAIFHLPRDHPRMCGEHSLSINHAGTPVGSSPHVRGAPLRKRGAVGIRRIIPACAGSTCWWRCCCPCWWDHPRMCGEHSLTRKRSMTRPGSSPHVRGAHRRCSFVLETKKGSSPHVRGALMAESLFTENGRIIPACAGSTGNRTGNRAAIRDHPRMCGEHRDELMRSRANVGSSPHVRGALVYRGKGIFDLGIIPACAGSTLPDEKGYVNFGDHPRMCGEHTSKIA